MGGAEGYRVASPRGNPVSNIDKRPVCFVVMGFGKKTEFETGRTLDLDATYNAIISPAVAQAGLRCIRSDEIIHSGIIDIAMYEMLLRAELVIADISTGNVNAVYELGVRHALRPQATIVMKENVGRLYFDLDHTNTFHYEHLGKDIGHTEALRAQSALSKLIRSVLESKRPDSPVYTYLPALQQPRFSEEEYRDLLDSVEATQAKLSSLIEAGQSAFASSDFSDAAKAFAEALQMKPGEPYLVQQLALATYKSEIPSKLDALIEGLRVIEALDPDQSNDPETLGISGAIRKRIWLITDDIAQLNAAIKYYKRGFEVTRDYYNGENLALCYALRAAKQADADEATYDALSAQKVCEELIASLEAAMNALSFQDRSDQIWIYATLTMCYLVVDRVEDAERSEGEFMRREPDEWMINTFKLNRALLTNLSKRQSGR